MYGHALEGKGPLAPPGPYHHALRKSRIAKGGNVAANKAPELGIALVGPHANNMGKGHGNKGLTKRPKSGMGPPTFGRFAAQVRREKPWPNQSGTLYLPPQTR